MMTKVRFALPMTMETLLNTYGRAAVDYRQSVKNLHVVHLNMLIVGLPVPVLYGRDRTGTVLYVRTFTRTFWQVPLFSSSFLSFPSFSPLCFEEIDSLD